MIFRFDQHEVASELDPFVNLCTGKRLKYHGSVAKEPVIFVWLCNQSIARCKTMKACRIICSAEGELYYTINYLESRPHIRFEPTNGNGEHAMDKNDKTAALKEKQLNE